MAVRPLVPLAALREMVALSVEGRVEASRIRSGSLCCTVTGAEGGAVVLAEARSAKEPLERLFPQLYTLVVGLHNAGLDVTVDGPLAQTLPGCGSLSHPPGARPPLRARRLFCQQRAPSARPPDVEVDTLELVHGTFAPGRLFKDLQEELERPPCAELFPRQTRDPQRPMEWRFEHRSGLEVLVVLAGARLHAHAIVDPALVGVLRCDAERLVAHEASSWGEVWLDVNGHGRGVCPTEVVGDEVAVVMAGRLLRFRVLDRGTLEDLGRIAFGAGPPRLLRTASLLESATELGQRRELVLAREAAALALRGAANDEERREAQAAVELAEAAVRSQEASPSPTEGAANVKISVRPLAELTGMLGGDGDAIDAIAQACALERQQAADEKRDIGLLPVTGGAEGRVLVHRYEGITGADVLAAGVPMGALEQLGYAVTSVWPSLLFPEIFTIRLGRDVLWGSARTASFVVLGDPTTVYV